MPTKIDAHIHFADDAPEAMQLLRELDLRMLNICVASGNRPWRQEEREVYERITREHPDRFAWCTSFDPPGFDDPDYVDRAIESLDADFAAGAVACKVWKNIGMDVRKPDGSMIMVDDPLFEPIFEHLTRLGKPLLAHIGEPLACWRPLSEITPHTKYYTDHPQWHVHGRADFPSHESIMAARDRLLEKHPDLRVIGAHLGSLEYDVAEIARRFERYPNFAVDVSARASDLMCQDSDVVRQLFLDWPDRILFGTDIVNRRPKTLTDEQRAQLYDKARGTYQRYFTYFETDQPIEYLGRTFRGLHLPDSVLEKFYVANALDWYPDLRASNIPAA